MSDSRESKQRFLQAEIVDKGLSASDFTARCEELKGADVDNWTMEELQALVLEFQEEARKTSLRQGREKGGELFGIANESFAGTEAAFTEAQEGSELYTVCCQTLGDTELSTVSGVSIAVLE